WDVGVMQMKVGERATLTIPPEEGYGASGAGGVYPCFKTSHCENMHMLFCCAA
ncbi:hypothetical protein BaRGS_00000587, partial [Batillaria attramentaria]